MAAVLDHFTGAHLENKTNSEDGLGTNLSLDIAIVGGGIAGVITALGMIRAGYRVTVYEKTHELSQVGAGIAFTGVARECMGRLHPQLVEALMSVGAANQQPTNRYWDGFSPTTKEEAQSEDHLLVELAAYKLSYVTCLRNAFLRKLVTVLPEGVMRFGKQLEACEDALNSDKVRLYFSDGTVAEADAVIGCDGIHSRTRRLLLGEDTPTSRPCFTHKVAYRAVIPLEDAVCALGEDKANNQCAHMGPNAHMVSYPVNERTSSNVFIFIHDERPWPDPQRLTAPARKQEVVEVLKHWGPAIRELSEKLPEQLHKWAIFDMGDNPPGTYSRGRICLAGDAAHASSPFHGAGACFGVEDALVLITVLREAMKVLHQSNESTQKRDVISAAFDAFSAVRLERCQWLVRSSREMGDIYEWRHPDTARDGEKIKAEFERRFRKVWDFDVDAMITEAQAECKHRLPKSVTG